MNIMIFDLDNTIFDVSQYYYGTFIEISKYLSKKYSISEEKIYNKLKDLWKEKTSMYPKLFDDLLNILEINEDVRNIVKIFNSYNNNFKPYSDAISTFKELKRRKYKLGIITDGNVERQKRKIQSLGIEKYFDLIIYTQELNEPKPSKISFQNAIKNLSADIKKSYYIGDNPVIDFKGAKEVGLNTVRIKKGEFSPIPTNEYIDFEINALNELLDFV